MSNKGMTYHISRAETCENCGRDLPVSEWCEFCNHDNHKTKMVLRAKRRVRREVELERIEKEKV